ncbi:MAG: LLM class F420-dependent oxidoreductase [Acidimicrobiales bacterium]
MELGKLGVWWSGSWKASDASVDVAAELESFGYTTLWSSGGFGPGLSEHFEKLLRSTDKVVVASGIVSVWASDPVDVGAAVDGLDERYPGRFLLGIGASHAPLVEDYSKPYSKVVRYLDALDSQGPAAGRSRRILAALGDRMLRMSSARSLGAHPYFVPASHTERARQILGTGPLLAPEVTVVLEADPKKARQIARRFTAGYLGLTNYAQNIRTLGFDDDELSDGGSDRLVDAVVCWGDAPTVARKVKEYYEAGADHVCIQVLADSGDAFPLAEFRELAPAILGT